MPGQSCPAPQRQCGHAVEDCCSPNGCELHYQIWASLPGEFLTMAPTAYRMHHLEGWGHGAGRSRSRREAITHRPGFSQEASLCPSW